MNCNAIAFRQHNIIMIVCFRKSPITVSLRYFMYLLAAPSLKQSMDAALWQVIVFYLNTSGFWFISRRHQRR
jgi:hypothetical protein